MKILTDSFGSDHPRPVPPYEGTLDLVMLHSLTDAEIDDWKSYLLPGH
jgi:hypothetical protein